MRGSDRLFRNDSAIRVAGVLLVAIGVLAGRHLYSVVGALGGRPMPTVELLWGALAYLGCTSGGILTCLGTHIHDKVLVSGRWGGQPNVTRRAFVGPSEDMMDGSSSARASGRAR